MSFLCWRRPVSYRVTADYNLMSLHTNETKTWVYAKKVQGIDKDLLFNKIYDTIICKSLLFFMK